MSLINPRSRHDSKHVTGSTTSHNTGRPPKLPGHHRTITSGMSLLRNVKAFLTPTGGSQTSLARGGAAGAFTQAKTETDLFPATDPVVDGEECLRDCDACTVHYPAKFKIDEDDALYGHVNGWSTHLVVGTGKTDWVRDVADEKGSVMQAVGRVGVDRRNGKVMLSASNMAPSEFHDHHGVGEDDGVEAGSDCLLLPAWIVVEDVKPSQVDVLMREIIETSVTNTSPLGGNVSVEGNPQVNGHQTNGHDEESLDVSGLQIGGGTATSTEEAIPGDSHEQQPAAAQANTLEPATIPPSITKGTFRTRPIPHSYLILMCSHKTRDARCGQSAPLLRKEFERVLRPLGLYRDLHDDRPGGVGIYFINHVGGHKYSANVMIYRREKEGAAAGPPQQENGTTRNKEAVQLMWLARVMPEDCENIVRYTILQGKLVKPKRQLRAGFDRDRGLTSW